MSKVPKLNLELLEKEEVVKHEWIKNINLSYNSKTLNTLTNSEELKYFNILYKYKINLANKNLNIYLSDDDLISLNNNTNSVINLQLVPCISKSKTRSEPSSVRNSPKLESSSVRHSLKRSSSQRSKTSDIENKSKLTKLNINNIDYTISYKITKAHFNLFKFEKSRDVIKCFGILDQQAKLGSQAINYNLISVESFEIYSTPSLFNNAIYIVSKESFTVEQFLNCLPKNLTI